MSALQKVNFGTAPAGSDGDPVRAAFVKANSNVDVLAAQAALTSATQITAAQALTINHVGKRVNINLASAGTIKLPPLSVITDQDNVVLLRNLGSTVVTLAPADNTSDWVGLSRLNPGESALMDGFGGAWNVLMRGRGRLDNEIINGTLTVGAGISGNLPITGKVSAVNSPNLLPNGTGEMGNLFWNSSNFSAWVDGGGQGIYFINLAAISANTYDQAFSIPCGSGVPVTISGEIWSGNATAGNAQMGCDFLDASGNFISGIYAPWITFGKSWTFTTVSGVTPANTAYLRAFRGAVNSAAGPARSFAFRRFKLEVGSAPSLYSQEASIAAACAVYQQNNGKAIYPDSIEVGKFNPGASGSTLIDFHSGPTTTDYDARLLSVGGSTDSAKQGRGTLQLTAKAVQLTSDPDNTALSSQLQLLASGYQAGFRTNASNRATEWVSNGGGVTMWLDDSGQLWTNSGINANVGYKCKAGQNGAFGGNWFNINWSGSQASLYVDSSNIGVISTTSDERVKNVLEDIADGGFMSRVDRMRVISFTFKNVGIFADTGVIHQGVSANNLYEINPRLVNGTPDAIHTETDADGNEVEVPTPMTPDVLAVVSELIGAVKEQNGIIRALQERVIRLETAQ